VRTGVRTTRLRQTLKDTYLAISRTEYRSVNWFWM
jgi:hypothetical protein